MDTIPDFIHYMFWDVDISKLDKEKHKRFIIERVLKFGKPEGIRWLLQKYADTDIIETVKTSRNIDRKTANYWALHYKIPKEEVYCLKTQFLQECFY